MKESYRLSKVEVLKRLGVSLDHGLSDQQVEQRLEKFGKNELGTVSRETIVHIFFRQFANPLIYILLAAAVIIFFVGDHKLDAFIISGVLLFNAIIGTIQEGRTKNIIESLKRFIQTKSLVLRDGKQLVIQDSDIVPGDILILQAGQRIPADARVLISNNLLVDESILTGESFPVEKNEQEISQEVPIAEHTNVIFRGTFILSGTGKAVVVATGQETEIGKIHKSVEEIRTDIPLKNELEKLSYTILLLIFVMCLILLVIGFLIGRPIKELIILLTALFICVVPEGLPVVLTLVLVNGAYRMTKQKVVVKNLQAVEGLGRTNVIVTDKTGTLTRNEMMVIAVFSDDHYFQVTGKGYFNEGTIVYENKPVSLDDYTKLKELSLASALLANAQLSFNKKLNTFEVIGDPTEASLLVLGNKMGFSRDALEQKYQLLYEIPFHSALRYHAAFYQIDNKIVAYLIGAPELIFQRCTVDGKVLQAFETMLSQGMRIVCVAKKEINAQDMPDPSNKHKADQFAKLLDTKLEFLGLCGIHDAIRSEVKKSVTDARKAGLRIIMATGDHAQTAAYVAREVGILQAGDLVLTGAEFEKMSDQQALSQLGSVTVFARLSPDNKVRIVQLLHEKNNLVAMTGDGVNDVPSLMAADIGIAMGGIGTEVAKQAADLVLLDDSFTHIINAIEQGRHIFYTLRRVILYFFSTNMGEVLIITFALFTHMPLPLTAAQILWLNLVTDGFLDIGLSLERKEAGLLHASWLQHKQNLINKYLLLKMLYLSIPMAIGSLLVFWWFHDIGLAYARTMTLVTMAMYQWFNAFNCRSERKSLFKQGFFTNKWLLLAAGVVLILQLLLVYTPFMQYVFKTVPLSLSDWLLIILITFPIILMEELRKLIMQ